MPEPTKNRGLSIMRPANSPIQKGNQISDTSWMDIISDTISALKTKVVAMSADTAAINKKLRIDWGKVSCFVSVSQSSSRLPR